MSTHVRSSIYILKDIAVSFDDTTQPGHISNSKILQSGSKIIALPYSHEHEICYLHKYQNTNKSQNSLLLRTADNVICPGNKFKKANNLSPGQFSCSDM